MTDLKTLAYGQKKKMILLVVFALLSGASIILQAYLFAAIVNRVFLQGTTFAEVLPLIIGLLVVLLARTLFHYASGKTGIKMASKVKGDMRRALLDKFASNPLTSAQEGQSGKKVSVMLDTVDELDSYYSSYIPQVIQSIIIPIMILIIIFAENFTTGLIIVVTAPFIPIFMMVIGFNTKDKSEQQLDKMAAFSGKFLDTLQGLTTLKLFGRSKDQKAEIEKSSLGFRDATMEVLKVAFTNSLALEFIANLAIGIIALEIAIRLIIFQNISFTVGFLMLILAPEFFAKLKELGSAFHTGKGSMGAANILKKELDDTNERMQWGEETLQKDTPPAIRLQHMNFRYGEEAFALKDINIDIQPFEQVAIIGKTGSGKTTLLHLLAGLIPPQSGEMLADGKSRSTLKEKDWFDSLSYISQEPYLFSGTIAENIAIGFHGETSRAQIEHAGAKAGISELVASLDKGYDTPVGEAGRGLSGGEKQRVAIARAFLKRPFIILFDEPTTGLDLETERILKDSLNELAEGATVITVAHRLHTIKDADNILFLDNGELLASGTHEALISELAVYRNMLSLQQGGNNE